MPRKTGKRQVEVTKMTGLEKSRRNTHAMSKLLTALVTDLLMLYRIKDQEAFSKAYSYNVSGEKKRSLLF